MCATAFLFVVPLETSGSIKKYLKAERKQQETRKTIQCRNCKNEQKDLTSKLDQACREESVHTETHTNANSLARYSAELSLLYIQTPS